MIMQLTGNKTLQARLTIRVSKNTLSFSVVDREAEHQVIYEPYTVKSGISMAANLRQAFKESDTCNVVIRRCESTSTLLSCWFR